MLKESLIMIKLLIMNLVNFDIDVMHQMQSHGIGK